MKKLHSLVVRAGHEWSFPIWADPKYVQEWQEDGVEIDEIVNIIPDWVVNLGLAKLWCLLQDIGIINHGL